MANEHIAATDRSGRTLYWTKCGHVSYNAKAKRCISCLRANCLKLRRGYPWVFIDGKHRQVHRVIAEEVLGRPLKSNEVIHHIDMDKTNNANSNLLICTRSYHQYLHHKMQEAWVKKYKQGLVESRGLPNAL